MVSIVNKLLRCKAMENNQDFSAYLPALQPINILLLLLPALLGGLLIANLSAYFLQNPLFILIDRGRNIFILRLRGINSVSRWLFSLFVY